MGLLTKAEEAGFTPADLAPLLRLADSFGASAVLVDVLEVL